MEIVFDTEDVKYGGDAKISLNMFDDYPTLVIEKEDMVIEELALSDETMRGMIVGLRALISRNDPHDGVVVEKTKNTLKKKG